MEAIDIIRKNIWLLIAGPIICAAVGYASSFLIQPLFTSKSLLLIPQQQSSAQAGALQSLGALASLAGVSGQQKNQGDQYVTLLGSRRVTDRIIQRFELGKVYEQESIEKTRKTLLDRSRFSVGKKDGTLSIEVDDNDRLRSSEIANQYQVELQQLIEVLTSTELSERRRFFERELTKVKGELDAAERELKLAQLSGQDLNTDIKSAAMELADLHAKLSAAELSLREMSTRLTRHSPEWKVAEARVVGLKQKLGERTQRQSTDAPDAYLEKFRTYKYKEALVDIVIKQFEIARIEEAKDVIAIQVIDKAIPAERKSSPKRLNFVAYGYGSGLLAVLMIISMPLVRARLNLEAKI
jgi:uncharacterized protein involved in exopolysaccharide biosynthesis